MNQPLMLALAAALLAGGCAMPTHNDGGPRRSSGRSASIPFVEFGNINDWRADGERGIYIQSTNRKWYYATFMSPCIQLPYTESIGFRTTPPLPLDKFDSVLVRGEPCYFRTLEEIPAPPSNNPPPRPPR